MIGPQVWLSQVWSLLSYRVGGFWTGLHHGWKGWTITRRGRSVTGWTCGHDYLLTYLLPMALFTVAHGKVHLVPLITDMYSECWEMVPVKIRTRWGKKLEG